MKSLFLIALTGLFLFPFAQKGYADKKSAKLTEKVEIMYASGQYFEALRKNDKLINYLAKKFGAKKNLEEGYAKIREAKIKEALGKYDAIEDLITQGLKEIKEVAGQESLAYANARLEVARVFFLMTDYVRAQESISRLDEVLENIYTEKGVLEKERDYLMGKIKLEQGFYNEAYSLFENTKVYWFINIHKEDKVFNLETGKYEMVKLSKYEYMRRGRYYAGCINYLAKTRLRQGHYRQADSLATVAKEWMEDNKLKKDIAYVDNLQIKALTFLENDLFKESLDYIEDAVKLATKTKKIKYRPSGKEYGEIIRDYLIILYANGKNGEARQQKNIYYPKVKRYYPKGNPAIAKLEYIEAQKQYANEKGDRAIKAVEQALANKNFFPGKNIFEGEFYDLAFNIYLDNNQIDKAKEMREKHVELYMTLMGEEAPKYHLSLINKAIFLQDFKDDYDFAERVYENSFEKILKPQLFPSNVWYFEIENNYAKLFQFTDRYEEATQKLENATIEAKRFCGQEHYLYAVELRELGELYMAIGKYYEATDLFKKSWEIFRKYKNKHRPEVIETLKAYARLFLLIGNFDDAEKLLVEAQDFAEKSDVDIDIEEFAILYIKKGEFSKVEELLFNSIKNKKIRYGEQHRELISPYTELANLYLITGEFSDAETFVTKALGLAKEIYGDTSLIYAECLSVQGKVLLELGDYESAVETNYSILGILEKALGTKEHIKVANAMNELALAKYYNGESKKEVLDLFQEAREIIQRNLGQRNPSYAESLVNVALVYTDLGKYTNALNLLDEANSIWIHKSKLGKNNVNSAEIFMLKGDIAKKQKAYDKSLDFYDDAKGIYKNIFGELHPDYVYALSKSARIYYIKGDYKRSIKALDETTEIYMSHIEENFSFLSERQKVRFWSKVKNDFEFYNTLAFKYYEEDPKLLSNVYNNTIATKGLLLNSSIKLKQAVLSSGDPEAISLYEDWIAKRESYIAYQSMPVEQLKESGIVLSNVEKDIEDLERKLSGKSDAFAANREQSKKEDALEWKDIQDKLDEGEFAIEMVKYRYYDEDFTDSTIYAALIVSPDTRKYPDYVLFPDGKEMDNKYKKYYRNVMKFKSVDKKSYERFWKPIDEKINSGTIVYFSPEGVYNEINLEAIPTPDGNYVLDKNSIVLVGNTKDLVLKGEKEERKLDKYAMLIGNPAFYEFKVNDEKIYITIEDSVFAEESHQILISRSDNKMALPEDEIIIKNEDNIVASIEDSLYIRTEDKIFATTADSIYITLSDSILKSNSKDDHTYISIEDKIVARVEDRVVITDADSILARKRHKKVIQTSDNVMALARHKKYIDVYDDIYATVDDKIYITEDDQILNQDFYNKLTVAQLPGAEREINEINEILQKNGWETNKLVYDKATEGSVKETKRAPTFFHIATHGFFTEDKSEEAQLGLSQKKALENPLNRSGLILRGGGDILLEHGGIELNVQDGILTANEVMNLNFDSADLVVLSACETGKGEVQVGEGVNGLQRSFLVAGANTIIMSLFKVSDDATRLLMNSFYDELTKTNNKREAFIAAKKKVRAEYEDPIYWGAFVMIGMN